MRTYNRKRPIHQLIEDVHGLCRLCLSKSDSVVPIFNEDKDDICSALALRIMICVGLKMERDECLPSHICEECRKKLEKHYTFRKKCELSYQKLKSHVLAVKQKDYKMELELQNESKTNINIMEPEENMKLVVTFESDQITQVSYLNKNGVASGNNVKNELPEDTSNYVEININQESTILEEQVPESEIAETEISPFLTAILLQLGIITQEENGPILTEENINTLDIEMGDGRQVTYELVEEEDANLETVLEESVVIEEPLEPKELVNTEQTDTVVKYITTGQKQHTLGDSKKNCGSWCEECGKQFTSRSALHRHRRIHSGEKPYVCQTCGRTFTQKEVMMRHALTHAERRPHACGECDKSFTQRAALEAHARVHAPPQRRALSLHRCSRCPKVFLYASGLSRHMMMHLGRVYVCGACSRQFKDKSSLMRHFKNANHTPRLAALDTT